MKTGLRLFSLGFSAFLLSTQIASASDMQQRAIAAFEAARNNPFDDDVVEKYLATLPTIANPLNKEDRRYLLEGDIPRTAKEVRSYLVQKGNEGATTANLGDNPKPELIVHVENGLPAYWKDANKRTLKYAVIKSTFADEQKYNTVVADMDAATGDWEQVCPECQVDYQHVTTLDSIQTWEEYEAAATADKLTFIVIQTDSGGQFIASAFFPNETWDKRIVLIDNSYFTSSSGFTGRGVLRHELGHSLGYRHEHTRGVPGCFFEDNNWQPLTPYDPHSVMHYFCGGAGSLALEISDVDRTGHKELYGSKK